MVKPQDEIKKVGKTIHPKSRKAKQLNRKVTRDVKMAKKKCFTNMKLQLLGERIMWFKENVNCSVEFYTVQQMNNLIEKYINRHSEEIDLIYFKQNIGNRKSRQHASREDILRINKENDLAEFNSLGLETIDLTDKENFKSFMLWSGELRLISNLKLKKFKPSTNNDGESSQCDSSNLLDFNTQDDSDNTSDTEKNDTMDIGE